MNLTNRFETKTYDFGNCYYVDIVIDFWSHTFDAYIFHSQYGVKMHMFGHSMDDMTYDEFLEFVDFAYSEYLVFFEEEYVNE